MVDVKQRALRPFEQDALACRLGAVECQPDRLDEGQDEVGDFGQFGHQRGAEEGNIRDRAGHRVMHPLLVAARSIGGSPKPVRSAS